MPFHIDIKVVILFGGRLLNFKDKNPFWIKEHAPNTCMLNYGYEKQYISLNKLIIAATEFQEKRMHF